MVDALRDAWRALAEGGTLLDLRPRAAKYPLELVTADAALPVGYTDTTSRIDDDTAADAAVATAMAEGWFSVRAQDAFEVEIFWDSVHDLERWVATRPSTRVSPSFEELETIYRKVAAANGDKRLRAMRRLVLGSYTRHQP